MKNDSYILVIHKPYETKKLKIDETFSQIDITNIDLQTLFYTKKEFLEEKRIQGYDIFIARITSVGKITIYDCLFKQEDDFPVYQKINSCLINFAEERLEKRMKCSSIALDKTPPFKEYTRMILNNITSNTEKKLKVTSSKSLIKPTELKEKIRKISTSRDFQRELPKIQEFLIYYKTLRALTLEYLNCSIQDTISLNYDERNRIVYDYFVREMTKHKN